MKPKTIMFNCLGLFLLYTRCYKKYSRSIYKEMMEHFFIKCVESLIKVKCIIVKSKFLGIKVYTVYNFVFMTDCIHLVKYVFTLFNY